MHALTELERLQVIAVTEAFDVAFHSARRVSGGFSGADVFQVTANRNACYALRRLPAENATRTDHIVALHRLTSALSDQGLTQIARPLPVVACAHPLLAGRHPGTADAVNKRAEESGPPLLQPNTLLLRADGVWQMEAWLPGVPRTGQQLSDAQTTSAMSVLSRFYALSAEFAARADCDERFQLQFAPSPALRRRVQILRDLMAGELDALQLSAANDPQPKFRELAVLLCRRLKPLLPQLYHQCQRLADECFTLQPVIRDLWSAHVLFTDDQVTGIIDLNASGTDHPATDLSRLQRSWHGNDVGAIHQMIQAFQQQRAFDSRELQLLEALDASTVMLSPVHWLRQRHQQRLNENDDIFPSILARFEMLVRCAVDYCPLQFDVLPPRASSNPLWLPGSM